MSNAARVMYAEMRGVRDVEAAAVRLRTQATHASPMRLLGTKFGVLPDYQSLVKGDECAKCIYDHDCAGFYESYVAQGLFEFRCVRP
jgi:hypothetical protein